MRARRVGGTASGHSHSRPHSAASSIVSPVMHSALIPSPIGPLYVEAEDGRLTRLYTDGHPAHTPADPPTGVFAEVRRQLGEYFAGERTTFDLPLREHGTP